MNSPMVNDVRTERSKSSLQESRWWWTVDVPVDTVPQLPSLPPEL